MFPGTQHAYEVVFDYEGLVRTAYIPCASVHSQWLATSPARPAHLAAMAPHRAAQIKSFGIQHESTFEAPAGVHNGYVRASTMDRCHTK